MCVCARQAGHLEASTCILCGRRGAYGTGLALVVCLGPVGAVDVVVCVGIVCVCE